MSDNDRNAKDQDTTKAGGTKPDSQKMDSTSSDSRDNGSGTNTSGSAVASGELSKKDVVRSLASARPFAQAVAKYQKAGWGGTLPLPAGKKNPPPTGFTGHKAPYPTKDELLKWLNDPKHKRANICIRLAGTGLIPDENGQEQKWEIVGIDVDHYIKGDKEKKGGDQLRKLEDRFGELPKTWTSSARTDGISGIRYYRVPCGLAFRGQVDKDIECIYKGYRFAVVWPSTNPDAGGEQYWWFPPGVAPTLDAKLGTGGVSGELGMRSGTTVEHVNGDVQSGDVQLWDGSTVPKVAQLPVLPDSWIEYLTQGRMTSSDDGELDMESSVKEIYDWADETFNDAENMCSRVRKSVAQQTKQILEEATSHDKLIKSEWEFYKLASEGHTGWKEAVQEIERVYTDETVKREKRDLNELRGEMFRSRTRALRKMKTEIDRKMAIGAIAVPSVCTCLPVPVADDGSGAGVGSAGVGSAGVGQGANTGTGNGQIVSWLGNGSGAGGGGGDGLEYVRFGSPDAPDEYRMNDDGNAQHFVDLFTSPDIGPGIRFVDGYGWIVWSSGSKSEDIPPRWVLSEDGLIRRAWQRVRDRQEQYAELLEQDFNNQLAQFRAQQNNPTAAPQGAIKAVGMKVKAWKEFSKASGMNRIALAALDAAKALPGVTVDINDLDADSRLIGVKNGVIELSADNATLRSASASDLITLNTNVAWKDPLEINRFGREKWDEYLEKFLPDEDIRRTAQVALGHTLIGGNPEKIFIILKGDSNTGKSTMANMCAAALGDYAMTANLSIYQNHKLNPLLAKALTRRLVVTTELSEDDKISASMLKRITGGSDLISAELKGSNVIVERIPHFVPLIATNAVPHIDGADQALRNRLYVIPFNVVVNEREDDKEAAMIIKAVGLEAVLNWLVEGYKIYRREKGLPKDPHVVAESDAFAADLDTVSTFIGQCVKKHPSQFGNPNHTWQDDVNWIIEPLNLFETYWRWCEQTKVLERDRLSQHKFSRRFSALGFSQKQLRTAKKSTKYWIGVKLVGKAAPKVSPIDGSVWKPQ